MNNGVFFEAKNLCKSYILPGDDGSGAKIEVLKGLSLSLSERECVAVIGASGVGKSTLLYQLGALDLPDEGEIFFDGKDIVKMSSAERAQFRARYVGFVFQYHHLLPEFSALENVAMPLLMRREEEGSAFSSAREALASLGLEERLNHHPSELSAGEAQRVAIARATVGGKRLIIADEPTGNLDEKTAQIVFDLLLKLKNDRDVGIILATHNIALADRCDRVLQLSRGAMQSYAAKGTNAQNIC